MRVFSHHREVYRAEGYEIRVVGGPPPGLRDAYHALLRVPWWAALTAIVASYLALNALFAGAYLAVAEPAPGPGDALR